MRLAGVVTAVGVASRRLASEAGPVSISRSFSKRREPALLPSGTSSAILFRDVLNTVSNADQAGLRDAAVSHHRVELAARLEARRQNECTAVAGKDQTGRVDLIDDPYPVTTVRAGDSMYHVSIMVCGTSVARLRTNKEGSRTARRAPESAALAAVSRRCRQHNRN